MYISIYVSLSSIWQVVPEGVERASLYNGGYMAWKFKAHFNRVNMQRGLKTVWTVHFRNKCIPCEGIRFELGGPVTTLYNPLGKQPRATLNGYATKVNLDHGVAVVSSK